MRKNTVYIIEDEEITYVQISYFLKVRGFEIIGQSNAGEDAIPRILKLRPDVVLVDINLTGKLDGIETTEFILREYYCPIIYITSDDSPATLEKLMRTRPYGFLRKPLRFDALCNTIDLALERFHTERQLKESEALFSQVINSLRGYSLIMLKPDGSIFNWNESSERMLGFKYEEIHDRDFSFLFPQEDSENNVPITILENVLKHGSHSLEVSLVRRNQTPLPSHLSITPFRDESGILKGFSVVIKDISESKKIEKERQELQEKLKKYNDELEKRVQERTLQLQELNSKLEKEIHLNHVYERQLEKSRANLLQAQKLAAIGDWEINFITEEVTMSPETYRILEMDIELPAPDFHEMIPIISKDEKSKIEDLLAKLHEKSELSFDKEIVLQNGKSKYLNIIVKTMQDTESKIKGLFGTMHDITLRKKAEEEMNLALEKEKEINQIKERFVWMISHEFRTPLTVIQSNLQLIEKFGETTSEQKKAELIQKGLSACKRMGDLLEDILQIGKMKDRRVQMKPVPMNLVQFAQGLIEELKTTEYGNDRILFQSPDPNLFECQYDKKVIRQIFSNLLINALKYSSREKKVEMELFLKEDFYLISVKDEGIGIPEEDIPRIFDNFYRSTNVGDTKGSGIGLALVKEYIDFLGGKVHVQSILGSGTIIQVTIPKVIPKGLLP
jgi:PAS domain S-box-containing protein